MCQTLGWTILVCVDNLTYSVLGDVDPSLINDTANGLYVTSGFSGLTITGNAGPMQFNFTFLSPIEVRSHSSDTFNVY